MKMNTDHTEPLVIRKNVETDVSFGDRSIDSLINKLMDIKSKSKENGITDLYVSIQDNKLMVEGYRLETPKELKSRLRLQKAFWKNIKKNYD